MNDLIFSVFPSHSFVDLGLFQFGWERCKPAHSFGPAARNHYLFHYILSGKGTLIAADNKGENREYLIRSMQGFFLFPNQITTYIADSDIPWEYVWVEFDGLRVKSLLETAGFSPGHPVYSAKSKEFREEMAQELLYIIDHREMSPFHLIGHLYLFLDYLIRSVSTTRINHISALRDNYIHEAIVFIEHNFQNPITVEEIAETCGLNRSYFGKIFREAVGSTPQEFLMKYRMVKASELLILTGMPIGDIGCAVGYSNPLHFSRAFKHIYGISPREWRTQHTLSKENADE